MDDVILFIAAGFGLGWIPWAPGTFGSLLGLPLAWWMLSFSRGTQLGIASLLLLVAIPICHVAAILLQGNDPAQIVADEYLAFPVAVLGLSAARALWVMVLAFGLFRLFDIIKPPPIEHIEALGGGFGIVGDDVMAAVYAWFVLAVILTLRQHVRRR